MDELQKLKHLSGITDKTGNIVSSSMFQNQVSNATNKHQIAKEQKIQPGTQEWFQLWFQKSDMQGLPATFRGRVKKGK